MGWFQHPEIFESTEFKALPADIRSYISRPTVPNAEIITHMPPFFGDGLDTKVQHLLIGAVGQVPQSQGTVKLASSDPIAAPIADPAFYSHPFDKRTMIVSLRHTMQLLETPAFKSRILMPLAMPKSTSDEDILEYMRATTVSTYHPSCTVKMGKIDDEMACLGTDFRVMGLQKLRVADLSSLPILPNCHPQSVAYLVGLTAAERIMADYSYTS